VARLCWRGEVATVSDREAYRAGIENLLELQRKLKRPIKTFPEVHKRVTSLVKNSGLKHTSRERYFTLLATSALLGRESMYNGFEPKRKRRT
jgi:hypothetical protein